MLGKLYRRAVAREIEEIEAARERNQRAAKFKGDGSDADAWLMKELACTRVKIDLCFDVFVIMVVAQLLVSISSLWGRIPT